MTLVLRVATVLRDDYDWATEFKISFGVVGGVQHRAVLSNMILQLIL
jgi:hypothetical protein